MKEQTGLVINMCLQNIVNSLVSYNVYCTTGSKFCPNYLWRFLPRDQWCSHVL